MRLLMLTTVALTTLALSFGAAVARTSDSSGVRTITYATAHRYSLWGTLAPTIVGIGVSAATGGEAGGIGVGASVGGLVIGPGLGHLYAGNTRRFLIGVGLRTGVIAGCGYMADRAARENDGAFESLGAVMFWGGLGVAVAVGSAISDISATNRSVDRYNAKYRTASVSIAPVYLGCERAPGLIISWRF